MIESHNFYCCKCGAKGIPVVRKQNKLREKMHLKQLWCINCKEVVNHVECYDDKDVAKFLERFKNGYYIGKEYKEDV
jgi:hypothetical protein